LVRGGNGEKEPERDQRLKKAGILAPGGTRGWLGVGGRGSCVVSK